MLKIAIYGKGGIGKSTVSANIACAMAEMGLRVMLVGCDPKADSARTVCGRKIKTLLDGILNDQNAEIESLLVQGYQGVICAETGGPKPGDGCAGRGVVTALRILKDHHILSAERFDVVIFDVLGDVVCGGFSLPLKEGFADRAYIVTTCDSMALYAANNICHCIRKFAAHGGPDLGGIVYNERSVVRDVSIPRQFCGILGTEIVGNVPADPLIMAAEISAKTIIEAEPESETASCFRALARQILQQKKGTIPKPMGNDELDAFLLTLQKYYK